MENITVNIKDTNNLTFLGEDTHKVYLPGYDTLVAYVPVDSLAKFEAHFGMSVEYVALDYFNNIIDSVDYITCPAYIVADFGKQLGITVNDIRSAAKEDHATLYGAFNEETSSYEKGLVPNTFGTEGLPAEKIFFDYESKSAALRDEIYRYIGQILMDMLNNDSADGDFAMTEESLDALEDATANEALSTLSDDIIVRCEKLFKKGYTVEQVSDIYDDIDITLIRALNNKVASSLK